MVTPNIIDERLPPATNLYLRVVVLVLRDSLKSRVLSFKSQEKRSKNIERLDWIPVKKNCEKSDAVGSNTKDLSSLTSSAKSVRDSALGQLLPGSIPEVEPDFELAYFGQFSLIENKKSKGKSALRSQP